MNILKYYQNEPIIGLAPMDGVSDAPYRFIQKKYGNPDLVMTEFTNVIGLSRGVETLFLDQLYHEVERPIIGQIYGSSPEDFYHASKIIAALKFDGVDINMGCPAKNVASSGAGAALIRTPDLAKEIVRQTKKGVTDYFATGELTGVGDDVRRQVESANQDRPSLPSAGLIETDEERARNFTVSVKTRIGFSENIVTDWMAHLTEVEPDWIALHGRTLKQMYLGHSDWDALATAVQTTHIPIITNGDVVSSDKAVEILRHTGAKGVLIGRGSFGNPWIFSHKQQIKDMVTGKTPIAHIEDFRPTLQELMQVMQEHADLHWDLKPERAFVQIRKNLAWYVKGLPDAAAFRAKLVLASHPDEVAQIIASILEQNMG